MDHKTFSYKYGFIGKDLELKQDIYMEIDDLGTIINLTYRDIEINTTLIQKGILIVPGFINSHVHIGDSFAKEKGFNKDLIDVVAPTNGLKHQLLSKVSISTKIEGIQNTLIEFLSNGITCFIDFREEGEQGIGVLKTALRNSPIRHLILGRYNQINEIPLIFELADGVGLSSYTNKSPEEKAKLAENKIRNDKIISCHCAEVIRKENLIEEIVSDQIVDVIVHGTKLLKEDLLQLKRKKISIVICPRCNGYFGVGFPPVLDMLGIGNLISLGTDNIMANSPDLFEEMRYLYRLARIEGNKRNFMPLTPKILLKMITINPALIFGLESEIGSISIGKKADYFTIDLRDPNYFCQLSADVIHALIVQRTRSENIRQVFINGSLVFER
ncbi:MAG: amidohydrolase family protein [Promethearchaeota archaeon]